MVNQWLNIIFQSVGGTVFGLSLEKMLPIKENKIPKWVRISSWLLVYSLMAIIKVFSHDMETITAWGDLGFIFITALYLWLYYGGSVWKRCLAVLSLVGAQFTAELAGLVVVAIMGIEHVSKDYSQIDMVFGSFVGNFFSILVMMVTVSIWRKVQHKGKVLKHVGFFIIFNLMQFVPVFFYGNEMWSQSDNAYYLFYVVFSILIVYVSIMGSMVILFGQAEKDEMKVELDAIRHQMELERIHYQHIEERREMVAKIRHDYNNMLTSVLALIHMNKTKEAENMLMELLDKLENTKEYPYCNIPIINAVLSEKKQICEETGIDFYAELLLPENISISQMDLCSIFGNLMDNAVRACTKESKEKPFISVAAGVMGDYLVIKCVNLSEKAPGSVPEGTGYGFKILKGIAKEHEGNFFTEYKDNIFSAQISLLIK